MRRRWRQWWSAAGLRVVVAVGCALAGCSGERQAGPPPTATEDATLDVWLEKMEVGSREFYAARESVVAAIALKEGEFVADIGAGTGLYSLLFARAVGPTGEVYAIDIEPRFLKLINQRAEDLDLSNVAAVLGRPNSITLPPASIDVAFISDTYNYFTDPAELMASVKNALKPGGRLYILDFDVPAEGPRPPALQHIRLGRDGVAAEVMGFGFKDAEPIAAPGLNETYMLRFTRP